MQNNHNDVQTDMASEIAGEATVESPPAERDSSNGGNGLDENTEGGVQLPKPAYQIDAPPDGV